VYTVAPITEPAMDPMPPRYTMIRMSVDLIMSKHGVDELEEVRKEPACNTAKKEETVKARTFTWLY